MANLGTFDEYKITSNVKYDVEWLGKNSEVIYVGTPLSFSGWVIKKAVVWDKIIGVSTTKKTLTATNETVEKEKINYRPSSHWATYKIEVTGWTLVQADINKYFNMDANQKVDYATATGTLSATMQLQLVSIISSGSIKYGEFKVINYV